MTSIVDAATVHEEVGPGGLILRDIARGGIAGAIAGGLVAGIGGRVVMRLAALAVPSAVGLPTENGNTIGEITLAGSVALVFLGVFFGLVVGAVWVALAPWIPGRGLGRALVTAPIAVAVGGVGLVDGGNVDFIVLRNDALVVAMLLVLVGLIGAAVSLVDDGLDRVLPVPASGATGTAAIYAMLAALGIVLTLPAIVGSFFAGEQPRPLVGLALVGCGAATLALWNLRLRGTADPPAVLVAAGRLSLLALVLFGTADLVPEVRGALGVD
jgi:hypothetical protein